MTSPLSSLGFFPIGSMSHADFLKQSPPLDPPDYKRFMERELCTMRDLGFTSYNMEFGWFDIETARGVFDWQRTDAVWELCDQLGLKVFPWLFPELTPRWLVRDHPDVSAVAATGYRSPSHSYGSSLARYQMRDFFQAVLDRYRGEQVVAYNVGIESGLFWTENEDSSEPAAHLWDYNPEVVAGFGPWLAAKYGRIGELNRIYRDHYDTFQEVEPPNSRYISEQFMLINQVPWLDWRLYMCDVLTNYVHYKASLVQEIVPGALVVDQTCNVDPSYNAQDIWKINARMDAAGTSVFVRNGLRGHVTANYTHDYFQSSAKDKPYWILGASVRPGRLGPHQLGSARGSHGHRAVHLAGYCSRSKKHPVLELAAAYWRRRGRGPRNDQP